jgi:hypothetical protein
MELESAVDLRDELLSELNYAAYSTGEDPATPVPSLGVYCAADAPWGGGYGLSILLPEDASSDLYDWSKETVDRAKGEADVAIVGPLQAYSCPSPAHLAPGCSISDESNSAGTLGGFVEVDGTSAILSCAHVLAAHVNPQRGDPVYHPGLLDEQGAPSIGQLLKFSELKSGRQHLIDAAVATYDPADVDVTWPQAGQPGYIGGVLPPEAAQEEPSHEKVGRSTRVTTGKLTRFRHVARINYGAPGRLLFGNVMVFESDPDESFSERGDSGSLIYGKRTHMASGLLFGGSPGGGNRRATTLANPLVDVLTTLDLELVYGGGAR